MKKFKDLTFDQAPHSVPGHRQGKLDLGNGLTLSVVYGAGTYSDVAEDGTPETYEVALFYGNDFVPLSTSDEVIGWRTESEVEELIYQAQTDEYFVKKLINDKAEYTAELYG